MQPGRDRNGDTTPRILRLIGVYHAQGSLLGELAYFLRARFGGTHCPLCDITHGMVREKDAWKRCRSKLPVPFETVHLDQRDAASVAASEGRTPCVLADLGDELNVLLGPEDLAGCEGSPERLAGAIAWAAERRGWQLD